MMCAQDDVFFPFSASDIAGRDLSSHGWRNSSVTYETTISTSGVEYGTSYEYEYEWVSDSPQYR